MSSGRRSVEGSTRDGDVPSEAGRGRPRARRGPAAGHAAAQSPDVQPLDGVHARGAPRARALGAAARRHQHDRPAGAPRLRQHRAQERSARALHRPRRAAGQERAPLLPRARRPPRGVPADRLHADRRARLPAVQPHLPPRARALDHARPQGPHERGAHQQPLRGRAPDRGDGQRAHPGPGRPGRRRHGNPGRQARALRGGRRHPPGADAAGEPGRRHRQRGAAAGRPLHRLAPRAAARRRLRRRGRRVRARGEAALPEGAPAVGGLQAVERLPAARALPQGAAVLQRRHPGHGGGGGGGPLRRVARRGPALRGRARGDRGSGRGGRRDRAPRPARARARGRRAGGAAGGDRARRLEGPRGRHRRRVAERPRVAGGARRGPRPAGEQRRSSTSCARSSRPPSSE